MHLQAYALEQEQSAWESFRIDKAVGEAQESDEDASKSRAATPDKKKPTIEATEERESPTPDTTQDGVSTRRPDESMPVASITTGARLETYAQQGPAGTGDIIINGGAAHLIKVGERVVIMSFANCDINNPYQAKRAILNEKNQVISTSRGAVANK